MMNPGGAAQMTAARAPGDQRARGRSRRERRFAPASILEATVVGNPIMHHLARHRSGGTGRGPVRAGIDQAVTVTAAEIGIALHPNARVYALPVHRGSRRRGRGGQCCSPRAGPTQRTTLRCSSMSAPMPKSARQRNDCCVLESDGPAFEGAQSVAVSALRPERSSACASIATLQPRFRIIGSDLWSDDPDFGAASAPTGVTVSAARASSR